MPVGIGVVANLAEAHLFLVVPVQRILLNDVTMSPVSR